MDSMKRWLLATGNEGKVRELRRLLTGYPVKAIGLADMNLKAEAPETGDTFLENARQKAEWYWQRASIPVLADDSGLEVDALDGAPGIYSARFGGFETHAEKNSHLLQLVREVPPSERTARFRCAAVYFDGDRSLHAQGTLEGWIDFAPRGEGGFGYDPIFLLQPEGPTLAQISPEEKNRISHRARAFTDLLDQLLG